MPSLLRTSAILFLTLCLLASAPPQAIAQADDLQRRAYLAGNGFLARGMDALAVEEYRKFLNANPEHTDAPTARYGLGVALQRLGRNEEAIEAIDGIGRAPGFRFATESQVVAAGAEFALGRHAEVIRRLTPMLATAEQRATESIAPLLIESMHRNNEHESAAQAATVIIDRFSVRTLGERGAIFAALSAERTGEDDNAIRWADWIIQNSEDDAIKPLASLCVARMRLQGGDAAQAARISQRVAEQGPESCRVDALNILAEALNQSGRTEEADRVYAMLQQHDGDAADGSILIQRGVIAFENGQFEQALRFFAGGDDGSERVARWAARCETRLGLHREAAQRLATIDDPSAGAVYEMAAALRESGETEAASAAFGRFLRMDDDQTESLRPHASLALASIDHAQGRYASCADRCRDLLDGSADEAITSTAKLLLAESLYLEGDLQGAKAVYTACLESAPRDASSKSIAYRLGMIHTQLGETATAETILRSVTRGASTPAEFAPGLRTLGDLAMGNSDWQDAVESYSAYFQITDGDAATRMKLGIALARLHREPQALESLDQAIEGDLPDAQRARAHLERGDLRDSLDDPAGATDDWRRAMTLDASGAISTAAGQRLSSNALASGDTDAARMQLTSLIGATEDDAARAAAILDLGRLELRAGENEEAAATLSQLPLGDLPEHRQSEALACLSIACARSGDDRGAALADRQLGAGEQSLPDSLRTPLLYERAWRHRRAGETDLAIACYERLIESASGAPIVSSATVELADLLIESGQTQDAIARLRTLTGSDFADPSAASDASIRLGMLLYQEGLHADAVDAMQPALDQSDPDDRGLDRARLLCGESLFQLGLWASAVTHLEIASESDDRSIAEPALLRLGAGAAELQRWAVSESAYRAVLDRFGDTPHRTAALFGIGWALESSGDPEAAIGTYREAAEGATETAARAQFQLGECLFALGRHEEAASELIKVDILYASPRWSAAALYEAGRCFDAIGERDKAIEQWEQVLTTEDAGEWAAMAQARLGEASRPAVATESGNNTPTNTDLD